MMRGQPGFLDLDQRYERLSAVGDPLRSKIRSAVEHAFARQKDKMKAFIRTIGISRAIVKIGMANIAYNMLLWALD